MKHSIKISILFLWIFLASNISAQVSEIEQLIENGNDLLYEHKNDSARFYYDSASLVSERLKETYLKYYSIYRNGYSYLREKNDFLALAFFTDIQMNFEPKTTRDSALLFLVNFEIDIISYAFIKDEVNPEYNEGEIAKFNIYLPHQEQIRLQFLSAAMYQQKLEYPEAILKYKTLINTVFEDKWLYEKFLYDLATLSFKVSEYNESIIYYKKLLNKDIEYIEVYRILHGIWACYYFSRDYVNALKYLKQGDRVFNKSMDYNKIVENYIHQGSSYFKLGDTLKALEMFDKAEKTAISKKCNSEMFAFLYLSKFYFYRQIKDNKCAEEYINKCFGISDKLDPNGFFQIQIYNQATIFYKNVKQDYLSTVDLLSEFDSLVETSITMEGKTYNYLIYYRYILSRKASAYYKLWERDPSDLSCLINSYTSYSKVLSITNDMYAKVTTESAKLDIIDFLGSDYENVFATNFDLYLTNKNKEKANELFSYLQLGKATLFDSYMQETDALYSGIIPQVYLENESKLKKQIERLEYHVKSHEDENINKETVIDLQGQLVFTKLQHDSLLKKIEHEFPDFATKEDDRRTYEIREVQEVLDKDQLLLDLYFANDRLFKLVITKSEFFFIETAIDSNFVEDILSLREQIQTFPNIDNYKKDLAEFKDLSYKLYQVIFGDIADVIEGKRLLIVPNQELNLIPFECLLTNKVSGSPNGYGSLPYLVKKNPISILYSQSQVFNKTGKLTKNSKAIAFAPDYNAFTEALFEILPGARKEVIGISSFFGAKSIVGSNATKKTFLSDASKHDIIHLALHSVISEVNPKHSQLVFSPEKDEESAYLRAFEIYGTRFETDLLVLSGCNTGSGKISNGEGVMHLARSFFFAGIKNIILTHWAVADGSSAELMNYFYGFLHEGNSVDCALQKAKIGFLQKADPLKHHPYYWAGYVSMGKPAGYRDLRVVLYALSLGFVFVIILFLFFKRKRSN